MARSEIVKLRPRCRRILLQTSETLFLIVPKLEFFHRPKFCR